MVLSFNYLREPRKPWEYAASLPVPRMLAIPLKCFSVCALFLILTWTAEISRLHEAERSRAMASATYAAQSRLVRDSAAYARRVAALMELATSVRRAAESGTVVARTLESVARDLPSDAWLTGITPDSSGVTLDGTTASLDAVRRTLLGFIRDPRAGIPELGRADLDESPSTGPLVHFAVHLSGGNR